MLFRSPKSVYKKCTLIKGVKNGSKEKKTWMLDFFTHYNSNLRLLAFLGWRYVLHSPPNAEALRIINGPIDTEASRQLTQELVNVVGSGITVAIVPIPDKDEKGAVIVINTGDGFKPASAKRANVNKVMKRNQCHYKK